MPVLECSWGMVMSVSVADLRQNCIRCGSVDLHRYERQPPHSIARHTSDPLEDTPTMGSATAFPRCGLWPRNTAAMATDWASATTV
jgi:hypothetical protein